MNSLPRKKHRFPKSCCVLGCSTKAYDRDEIKKRLFRFVQWPRSQMTDLRSALAKKRFWLWIDALDQNPRCAGSLWVCSEHFVTGRPAAPSHHWNVDWIPNKNIRKEMIENVPRNVFTTSQHGVARSDDVNNTIPPYSYFLPEVQPQNGDGCQGSQQEPDLQGAFCRFCLINNSNLRPLFPSLRISENHLVKIVEEVTCIRLDFETDYNSFVCHECQQKMGEFFEYRKVWQANDILLRAFREKDSTVEPIPFVVMPIERLMEEPCEESGLLEAPQSSDKLQESVEEKPDITAILQVDEPSDHNESPDVKPPIEELFAATEITSLQSRPKVDSSETEEKDRLIRTLMKQIRRETLSPKRRKSKGESNRSKKRRLIKSGRSSLTDHENSRRRIEIKNED